MSDETFEALTSLASGTRAVRSWLHMLANGIKLWYKPETEGVCEQGWKTFDNQAGRIKELSSEGSQSEQNDRRNDQKTEKFPPVGRWPNGCHLNGFEKGPATRTRWRGEDKPPHGPGR